MTARRRLIASGIAALLVVAACSVGSEGGTVRNAVDDGDVAGFRAHRRASGEGMAAIVAGVVEFDPEHGCVWLTDSGGTRYPVVWPFGATAQANPFFVLLSDGQPVEAGDFVEGGGGYVDAAAVTRSIGSERFPGACVHTGEAAVFNSTSDVAVTRGVGLDVVDTLIGRFSTPGTVPIELIAVSAEERSVTILDLVAGTVHRFGPDAYTAPPGAIDGAGGGGGFIHLWSDSSVFTYPGRLDSDPLVFEPEPLAAIERGASTLEVLPAPDGDRTWLIQRSDDGGTTLIELVNVVEGLARVMTTQLEGSWQPAGATVDGIVLVGDPSGPATRLIGFDGEVIAEVDGTALSVGWNGAAILEPGGSLVVVDAILGNPVEVANPGDGTWMSVGGPIVPASAPPFETGATDYLVLLGTEPAKGSASAGDLVVVDNGGVVTPLYELSEGSHIATWSRDEEWVIVVEDRAVTLVGVGEESVISLGDLIPESHWVLTAG